MTALTVEQENAITRFKDNLHLPQNGFHELIIEKCKEYQLPFQTVRTVFLKSQSSIEKRIRNDFSTIDESQLSKAFWLESIDKKLLELAADNVPVMETLTNSQRYLDLQSALSGETQADEEQICNLFEDVYEFEISKPLKAMLRTTSLFWSVKNSLFEMTPEQRNKFSDYPQYMEAIEHLLSLSD
ncbi:hypothetical protein [Vibrio sp. HN007]|uniref:hypothetical protein n=1 Tax=Vibrio iocasae TaxID=3098914 RepID=UPI0035D4950F